MEIKTFGESYKSLTISLTPLIIDKKRVDLNALLSGIINNYLNIEIKGVEKDNPDADMLLFEYGNYDFKGDGVEFNFSLKRQIFL